MTTRLSKSRIMASLQCLKRVHLEVNRGELAKYSKQTEAAFAIGHEVGDIAVELYGGENGTYIDYQGGSFARQLAMTAQLMTSMVRTPIFEATIEHEGVLVREDILLPVGAPGDESWDIIEVKASTRLKPEHIHDCAVQAWVHTGAGHPLRRISLAHIDREFVYPGGGNRTGLLAEHDLTEQVQDLMPSVPIWVERARQAAGGEVPDVAVGAHCTSPYPCPFMDFCWPGDAEYPIRGLAGSSKKLGEWVRRGYRDIRDVPSSEISSETQLRIHRITSQGVPELLPGAKDFADRLAYPRFYLDFETVAFAIPVWPGTRPYQTIPFQWSCHIEGGTGEITHEEFLDLSGEPPMRGLAERLIETLESDGPVLMYTNYEERIIRDLMEQFPDLADALDAIIHRLVDLHPVTKANYYHPKMLGSWSIKAVLPTIDPGMAYESLVGVQEGTEAAQAYVEAIHHETTPERKAQLETELRTYCRHDTEAMVKLVHFMQAGS